MCIRSCSLSELEMPGHLLVTDSPLWYSMVTPASLCPKVAPNSPVCFGAHLCAQSHLAFATGQLSGVSAGKLETSNPLVALPWCWLLFMEMSLLVSQLHCCYNYISCSQSSSLLNAFGASLLLDHTEKWNLCCLILNLFVGCVHLCRLVE